MLAIELLSVEEFFKRTLGGRPNQMDTTYYEGSPFQCGCGQIHNFNHEDMSVIRELDKMRLVIKSNTCSYLNCVKVKGVFRFRGFKTLFSAMDEE